MAVCPPFEAEYDEYFAATRAAGHLDEVMSYGEFAEVMDSQKYINMDSQKHINMDSQKHINMDSQKYIGNQKYVDEERPWRCPGCSTWNWPSRHACRACEVVYESCVAPTVECFDIAVGDDTDYEEDFTPELAGKLSGHMSPSMDVKFADIPNTDDDAEHFQRRCQTDLKLDRSLMLAAEGYIAPELAGELSGYLSASIALESVDVPSGLADISNETDPVDGIDADDGDDDDGTIVDLSDSLVSESKEGARSAMKDPEVEMKLDNAGHVAEYLAYLMEAVSVHSKYDGSTVAEDDSCVIDHRVARSAMKDPGVELKLVNASYDADYLAYRMKSDSGASAARLAATTSSTRASSRLGSQKYMDSQKYMVLMRLPTTDGEQCTGDGIKMGMRAAELCRMA